MRRIPITLTTGFKGYSESYYDQLICWYIAPFFTLFAKKIGVKNPNTLTFVSFFLMLASCALVLYRQAFAGIYYRIVIALLIQLAFIIDCSDGQLARITGRMSKLGAWLDRLLDRIGEFAIFTVCGVLAWWQTEQMLFVILGLVTGYGLTAFSLAMAVSDSCIVGQITKMREIEKEKIKGEAVKGDEPQSKKKKFILVVSRVFFFLNFGIGERYLYLSFFILLNRLDIMLFITSFLVVLRVASISHYLRNKLKKADEGLRRFNES